MSPPHPTSLPLPRQVVAAQGFAALQFILEEKFLGTFRMQVSQPLVTGTCSGCRSSHGH